MTESVIINCIEVEKIAKTVPASLNDSENENITNDVCIDSVGQQLSYVGKESVSITQKFVNRCRQTSPLRNELEESLNENKKDTSVHFIETSPTQFPAIVNKNILHKVKELHSGLDIPHSSERSNIVKDSPSYSSSKQTCSSNSLSDCNPKEKEDVEKAPYLPISRTPEGEDCNRKEKEDVEKAPYSPISCTPEGDKKLINDPSPEKTNLLHCVDSNKNYPDMQSIDGDVKFQNPAAETNSIGGTSSKVDADEESMRNSSMTETQIMIDLNPNMLEKENDSRPDLTVDGTATSLEDPPLTEKNGEPIGLTEVEEKRTAPKSESEIENIEEMIPTPKLDSKPVSEEYEAFKSQGEHRSLSAFLSSSEMFSKAQSSLVVDETSTTNVESPKEFGMESKAESDSFEADEQVNLSPCHDAQPLPLKSEPDKKGVKETSPCCSDLEKDIEEVKMDVQEVSEKNQAISQTYINLDNDVKPSDDEEKKGMDSLKISKVESFMDVCEGINESKKEEIENADIKPEAINKKKATDNPVEKIDSEEDCKEENKIDDDSLHSNEIRENDEIQNIAISRENESSSILNEASVVEHDSPGKVSFKDILKRESLESSKLSEQCTTNSLESEETIVIDEVETAPDISRTVDEKSNDTEDILGSEKSPTQTTAAKKEDIPSSEGESGKKRTFDSSTEVSKSFSPKRQRLDSNVNELGDHAEGTSSETTTVIMDSDDDSATFPQMSDKVAEEDNKMETNKRTIQLSGEMLRNLIKASMRSFTKNQVLEKEQLINDRMKKMEAAIDLWRETAKHLEKSMNELTSYTKEFRKCKSQAMKLKHLASRTVAVQVSPPQDQPKTANNSNHNRSTSLSLPPSVLRHPIPTQPGPSSNRPMAPSVGNMRPSQSTAPRHVGPGGPRGGPPVPQQPNRQKAPNVNLNAPMAQSQPSVPHFNHVMRPMANSHKTPQSARVPDPRFPMSHAPHSFQGSSSNMIDLTAEDDSSKHTKAAPPPPQRAIRGSPHSPAMPNNAHNSNLVRGSQPETNVVKNSNNPIVRSGSVGPSDRLNTSAKSLPGSSLPHANNVINGTSLGVSPPKSGIPVNSSGITNGKAASKITPTELSSKPSGTSGPGTSVSSRSLPPSVYVSKIAKHPAPLPVEPYNTIVNTTKLPPPKPSLKISRVTQGIVLSWNMPVLPSNIADIASYQLFAYQETNSAPNSSQWKKVGDVKALPLPMACTLVQFQEGNKYYFAVRAIDQFGRWGEYSDPSSIYLFPKV